MDLLQEIAGNERAASPASFQPCFPQSLRSYIRTVRGSEPLARLFQAGREIKAAYLAINNQLSFSERGHWEIIQKIGEGVIERTQPTHYGWFKAMSHPGNRRKTLFIIDSYSDYNRARSAEKRWDLLSLDEYFAFFYIVLIKSGAQNFSIRLACSDKRSAGVNEHNYKFASQLLFRNEKAEEEFIRQLTAAIRSSQ